MIKLAADTIDRADINALCNWLQQEPAPQLTKAPLTDQYEKAYAKRVGRKYAVFVNSGSSANLVAVYSLAVSNRLKNKKVVVPSVSWATTVAPVVQFGLEPILCDCNLQDLSVDLNKLKDIFKKENPSLLICVSVLGMVPDMYELQRLCDHYGVLLVMDNCESQASSSEGRDIESFGYISTCSSYYGHTSSTVEGGMITTDDEPLYHLLKSLRSHGWLRDMNEWERNKAAHANGISEFEQMYSFIVPGFNVRSTDISAFLGLRQLEKLNAIAEKRNRNFNVFNQLIVNPYWKPKVSENSFVCNLGYPIIHPKRNSIAKALIGHAECRPLISGSMGRQPFWTERYGVQELLNASMVHSAGLYVPNGPHISFDEIELMANIINKYTCG